MGKINDLDMSNWKELTDVWTDSLWIIPKRDNSGLTTDIITVILFRKYLINYLPVTQKQATLY